MREREEEGEREREGKKKTFTLLTYFVRKLYFTFD